jgi:predicted transcriptional regulator
MAVERVNDARAFRDFLDAQLAAGGAARSLDEILDLWQVENAPEAEREETLRAIRRGLDDMDAGRTVDAFESLERLRRKVESIGDLRQAGIGPDADREDTIQAIRDGLDDMDAGRTRPFEEFDREFRARNAR